ncbi:MAG TPA: tail fiber protein [Nitrosopumilaceae archaeon]|nr:tail fiber protein [Nitrosopumilaceae archaeon]
MEISKKILIVLIVIVFASGAGTAYAGIVLPTITLGGNVVITGDLDMEGEKIKNLANPTVNTDAATKGYADSQLGDVGIGTPSGVTEYSARPCNLNNPIIDPVLFFMRDKPSIIETKFGPIFSKLPIFAEAVPAPYIGEIFLFGGNFEPTAFAYADGRLLQISQYTALFSLYGTMYGGDGNTTFALPDMRCFESWHENGSQSGPRYIVALTGQFPTPT